MSEVDPIGGTKKQRSLDGERADEGGGCEAAFHSGLLASHQTLWPTNLQGSLQQSITKARGEQVFTRGIEMKPVPEIGRR